MEPLAIQIGAANGVRPVLALNADLSAVMREGRVVAGEVLQTLDGKSILIGIGTHRVPADSSVDLQPGERFLARVEKGADGTVLKVLGSHGDTEPRLAVALRDVVGEDRPVGKLLGDLASKLRSAIDSGSGSREDMKGLFEKLGKHVYLPGAKASDLRAMLARSGLDFEALLMAEASGGKAAVQLNRVLGKLVNQLIAKLQGLWQGAGVPLTAAQLESLGIKLLQSLSGVQTPAEGNSPAKALASLAAEIRARLGSAVASATGGERRASALAGLEKMLSKMLGEAGQKPLTKSLAAALQAKSEPSALIGNLKAELMSALTKLPEGAAKESVLKALAGIESEQLLNLARREFHEGWHLSLPIPEEGRWATAHLFYADPEDDSEGAGDGEDMQRITVAVDFSQIGPMRAEIGVRDDLVALRLSVTDAQVAARLQAEAPELIERLSSGGRTVRVAVVLGKHEEVAADALSNDIRWLREHHLMDLSG